MFTIEYNDSSVRGCIRDDSIYVNEQWQPDVDYDNYWVSTNGRVWSCMSNSFIYGSPYDDYGHIGLSLWVNKNKVFKSLHRMVAEAFIPNPCNLPLVRHLDDDPSNNCVDNLAWGYPIDNTHDCIANGHFRYLTDEDRERGLQKLRNPVIAVDIITRKKYEFKSQSEAARELGVKYGSINAVLHGKYSNAGGYYFYKPNDNPDIDFDNYKCAIQYRPIRATNLTSGEKYIFRGPTEAARILGISPNSVTRGLKPNVHSSCGYRFEYVDKEAYRNGPY